VYTHREPLSIGWELKRRLICGERAPKRGSSRCVRFLEAGELFASSSPFSACACWHLRERAALRIPPLRTCTNRQAL